MFHYYTPWCFQGVQKWNIAWKWVKRKIYIHAKEQWYSMKWMVVSTQKKIGFLLWKLVFLQWKEGYRSNHSPINESWKNLFFFIHANYEDVTRGSEFLSYEIELRKMSHTSS